MKRTAAVIVTYNRKAMLQRCLRALCTQTAGVPELWVIDNASTDGTAELVAQLNLPTMHYYNTGKNLGGAGGFACGIHLPLVLGFTVIIIPNLDPAKLGSLVLKYKPEHMFGVPAHYQQMASSLPLSTPRSCCRRMPNWTGSTAGFPPAHWRRTVKTSP